MDENTTLSDLLALNPTLELDASPARLLPMIVRPEEQP